MGPSCSLTISHVGPTRKHSLFGHKINPLLTKLICLRQPDIGLVFFFKSWLIKMQKKELGRYPAILTSHLVSNTYIMLSTSLCVVEYI